MLYLVNIGMHDAIVKLLFNHYYYFIFTVINEDPLSLLCVSLSESGQSLADIVMFKFQILCSENIPFRKVSPTFSVS